METDRSNQVVDAAVFVLLWVAAVCFVQPSGAGASPSASLLAVGLGRPQPTDMVSACGSLALTEITGGVSSIAAGGGTEATTAI
jgi:hypothetical protein